LTSASEKFFGTASGQQLHVIGELGHGANRGTRGAHRVGLVDRDRRWNALDPVHLRLVHALQELARVRREGLHVAALAFGIEGIEHQRRLAGAGHAGHDQQFIQRKIEIELLEVILARAADADDVVYGLGHGCGAGDRVL
jgi:hypothetical protein